jgi:predicted dinucleotide-binding enzyme
MKIAVLGRGNVGGGLANLWERAAQDRRRGSGTPAGIMFLMYTTAIFT